MKTILALAAAVALTACGATTQCVQPDPLQPNEITTESQGGCWNQGVNCGQPLEPVNAQ
jgi:hypothetical protein